jgi:hypothetical protein
MATHLDDSSYLENQVLAGEVDEVYQDDELSYSFNIDPDSALNSLLGDANDVIVFEQRKQTPSKKKRKILNILYISYYIHVISYYVLYISLILCDDTTNIHPGQGPISYIGPRG